MKQVKWSEQNYKVVTGSCQQHKGRRLKVWFLKDYFSQMAERGKWDLGFWLGRSWLARLFLSCKIPSPSAAGSQSSVCACVCVGGWGGALHWSQLLPVSAKSHGSHLDEAVAAQLLCRQAGPSEPRPLPSAPVPDPASQLAAEDQRESSGPGRSTCQHAGLHTPLMCVCSTSVPSMSQF